MFKKISFRVKVILLIIFCLIGIGIIIKEGISNRKITLMNFNKSKVEQDSLQMKNNSKEELKQKEAQNKAEMDKKQALEEKKQSELEQKYQLGYTQFHSKKYKEAIDTENQVITEDANFYKAYSIKGIALCYSGEFDQGMASIDKALQINNVYGYGRFNKALAYELYGHYDEALNWYNKALEVEKYVWSYYGIASIYGRRGDVESTVKYLKLAINISADVKDVAKKEEDFAKVRNSKEFKEIVN